jgi:AraC-like DNA-binding protein
MEETGAYGERLRKTFKVARAPSLVARTLKNARIAVTEIRCDKTNTGLSEPIPVEDAFLMTVQLRDVPAHDLFLGDRQVKTDFLPAGTASFYDLRSSPMANSISAFNHISFYVPRAALAEITEKEDLGPIDAFNHDPGIGVRDPILHNLVQVMLPAFRSPSAANQLFIDHLTVAATAHAVRQYGGRRSPPSIGRRKLSRRERTLAEDMLSARLDGNLSLDELSGGCSMSPLEFASAFEETAGVSVHAWRIGLRIERAKRLLARGYDAKTTSQLLGYGHLDEFIGDFCRKTGVDLRRAPTNERP